MCIRDRLQALGVEREKLESALKDFGANTSGGFLEAQGREYPIRAIGRTRRIEDLQNLGGTPQNGQPVLLQHCLLYTYPSPRDRTRTPLPSSA